MDENHTKRAVGTFLGDGNMKGTELGRKIVPVRPPKFLKGEKKEVCCIFEENRKIRVKRFRNNFSGGRYPVRGLNETFITALWDTGAEKSFIPEEVYRK
ncbi:hypothetical protein TNCV_2482151 [Trichonephila clavipes]|nr:hypothetical protein TNCV_2482151 [Trichonephila clavipes]